MTTRVTFAVQHPDMSHALLIDTDPLRTERGLKAWASMYVLKEFDAMLDLDGFVVAQVPDDTDPEFTLFPNTPTKGE